MLWNEGLGPRPTNIELMRYDEHFGSESGVSISDRIIHTVASVAEVGVGVGKGHQ